MVLHRCMVKIIYCHCEYILIFELLPCSKDPLFIIVGHVPHDIALNSPSFHDAEGPVPWKMGPFTHRPSHGKKDESSGERREQSKERTWGMNLFHINICILYLYIHILCRYIHIIYIHYIYTYIYIHV